MIKRAKNANTNKEPVDDDSGEGTVLQLTLDDEEENRADSGDTKVGKSNVAGKSRPKVSARQSGPGKDKTKKPKKQTAHNPSIEDADDDDEDPFADETLSVAPEQLNGDELMEEYGENPPVNAQISVATNNDGTRTRMIRTPTGVKPILALEHEPDSGVCVVPFEVGPLDISVNSTPEELRKDDALHYAAILSRLRAGWRYVTSVDSLCKLALTTDKILESRFLSLMGRHRGGSGSGGGDSGGLLPPFNHG